MLGYVPNQGAVREGRSPVLSSPVDMSSGVTAADIGVTTDEANGTLYAVVTTSATPPSKAQVKAGQDHSGAAAVYADDLAISTTGAKVFAADGLSAGTTYYSHFMHEDAVGNQSAVASADGFTTSDAPDTTAPVISSPTDSETGEETATLTVTTDEGNGALYWILSSSVSAPSRAQVKAGQDHTGAAALKSGSAAVTGTGLRTVNVTGLTYGTAYYAHFMHEDAAGNQSNVASGDGFTTDNDITPSETDYTTSQTITCPDYHEMDWEVVAGGGGGGANHSGNHGATGNNTSIKISEIIQIIAYGGQGGRVGADGAGGSNAGSYLMADSGEIGHAGDNGITPAFFEPGRGGEGGAGAGPFGGNGGAERGTINPGFDATAPGGGGGGAGQGGGGGQGGGYGKRTIRRTDTDAPVPGVTQLQITIGGAASGGSGNRNGGDGARGQFRITVR